MLQDMEEPCNVMLEEGENHQDFSIDLLNLATVQDKSFLCALEKIQDAHDSGEIITNESIIQQATAKHLQLISRDQDAFSLGRHVNLTTDGRQQDSALQTAHQPLVDWRDKLIARLPALEHDGRKW